MQTGVQHRKGEIFMHLSLKYWKYHKGHAAAILCAIVVSTMAMTIGMFLARSASQGEVEEILQFQGDYDIVAPVIEAGQLSTLAGRSDIAQWGVIFNGGTCRTNGEAQVRYGAMEDEQTEGLFYFRPDGKGRYPVREGEITGYKSTFEALGVAAVIGNTVELELYDINDNYIGRKVFTIVGVLNEQNDYTWSKRSMEYNIYYTEGDIDFPELFIYRDDIPYDCTVTAIMQCSPDVNPYETAKSLKADGIKAYDNRRLLLLGSVAWVEFETENDLYSGAHVGYNDFYSSIVIPAFVCIIMAVSFFSIYGVMSDAMMERQRQLGLLRSIGISGRKARKMLIAESAVFCLAGVICGYALGILVYAGFLRYAETTGKIQIFSAFNAHPVACAMSLNPYVYPWLIAVIFCAAAFMAAVFKGLKSSPLEMLHPEKKQQVKKNRNRADYGKRRDIIGKFVGRNINRDAGVIIVIFLLTWTIIFGTLFMMSKSDFDNMFAIQKLDEISGVDVDYSAVKDIYDTMVANVQFNRHNEGISKENLQELRNSSDTGQVTGIIRMPGIKVLYNESEIDDGLRETLNDLDISNNIYDFLSELDEKSLLAQGYGEHDLLYNVPATAVDIDMIESLENYVVSGVIDMEGLRDGTKVIIAEFEGGIINNPYAPGDRLTLTDTVIYDGAVENHDFSHGIMPEGVTPTFTYDYSDGSVTDLEGYSFGEKVTFDVEVCAVIHIDDELLCNMLYSESYVMSASRAGYVSPDYNILCCTEAIEKWGLPDTYYTDVFVNLSDNADIDSFEMLWYSIVGGSGAMKSVSRETMRIQIMKAEISNMLLVSAMIIMTVVTAVIGIINSYNFAVRKNLKNFQIIRAIGASRKRINIAYIKEMFLWPVIAAVTSLIPIQIFDSVKNYAYHYAFDLGHNAGTLLENGKYEYCWQVRFPWYIELWDQPVFSVMIAGAVIVILVNTLAGLIPMGRMKKLNIADGIRNEEN